MDGFYSAAAASLIPISYLRAAHRVAKHRPNNPPNLAARETIVASTWHGERLARQARLSPPSNEIPGVQPCVL
jgi:hypothetical protein